MLHKVAEERELNPGEMIYLYFSLHKKPSSVGSKNWIFIQDLYTKQKLSLFTKTKEYLTEKVTPFLNKTNTMKKTSK